MLGRAAERLGDSNPSPHGCEDDLLTRMTAVWLRYTTAATLQTYVVALPFFSCLLSSETGHLLSGAEPATPSLLHLSFAEDTPTDLEPLLLLKKDSSEGQHLLLLLGCLFFSYTSKKTPLNRPGSPSRMTHKLDHSRDQTDFLLSVTSTERNHHLPHQTGMNPQTFHIGVNRIRHQTSKFNDITSRSAPARHPQSPQALLTCLPELSS